MMAEGRTERMCSECESMHRPRASMRARADAAIVARVRREGLNAWRMRRTVCIEANTTRKSFPS
jgi:hypothetical protein